MLNSLSIRNYALIDTLNVTFNDGFTIITGETGAGKSILLGGLGLVLGKRADLSALRDETQKCIIEATFDIKKYHLKDFFISEDLDFEEKTIIRREILPSGKSRAFVNDSPVTLGVLSSLGDRLIDIHSQHQTLQLADNDFQLKVIDALAGNAELLVEFGAGLSAYQKTQRELKKLIAFQENATKEYDYNSHLLKELETAPLKPGTLEELEEQYEQLNNVEVIEEHLSKGNALLNDEQIGIVTLLTELKLASNKLAAFGQQFVGLNERINSVFIEVDDISSELQLLQENSEANPELLEQVNTKLQLLYNLFKKHSVATIEELDVIKDKLSESVSAADSVESDIKAIEKELKAKEESLDKLALTIRNKRIKVIPVLQKQLLESLGQLGMPSATFKIEVNAAAAFNASGKDELVFLFAANKGSNYGDLKKVASGGELSRIMLTIKSILAKYEQLPTMMFDEIDTGVSGEISGKMGDIMKAMSGTMQVFSITHLPQVASKGEHHFKVYKEEQGMVTHTRMKKLTTEERVRELAEMLGGKDLSESALAHAKQLLG
ncbi:DNA repair protein RecN [Cellulophaga sp. HaHa_2_1]|uniref:DNA repair protein RecN n=1 Tax=Cellulophaga sp. HaHa_2_1 TaxID=2749994 RepID=UPI001C4F1640|nr:DNA repair protein RecN [Cellulophaga sp. HaHa_2_1]QXP53444.1 DNA repair protein RecN [Cellulophaga sp. HaHa_2_1]